jgi:hypothetical protein
MRNIELSRIDGEPLEACLFRPVTRRPTPSFQQRLEDRQFLEMEQAFRASGGIASGDELAGRLRRCSEQPISVLARWIVERRAVSFPWQSQTLLPLFQFDLSTMTLRPAVIETVCELKDVFDDWDLAMWFARPNAWLSDSSPVNLIEVDAPAVLNAARADRFIAQG